MHIANDRSSAWREHGVLGLTAIVITSCLLFGGATRSGYLSDPVLQLLSVPLLLVALWRVWDAQGRFDWPLAFGLSLGLVPLFQLVPLPPQIWTALPFRDVATQSLVLAGQDIGWRPLSLTPHATWLSFASLIPPMAVFLATLLLSYRERQTLVLIVIGLGLAGSFLGLLQVAQGPQGWLQGIGLASAGDARGVFANRNHFAALLYAVLIFAAAFAINSTKGLGSHQTGDTRALVAVVLSFTVLVALLAAQMMARSRAGLGLTIVALFGIAALASSDDRGSAVVGAKRLISGAVVLVLIFASQFALFRIMARFAEDPLADARLVFAGNTWEAARSLMPFGSGLGSFVPVYQHFEKPQDALVDVYANRAHNDVLEVWLETGLAGLVLMVVFVLWGGVRFWQVWQNVGLGGTRLDQLLARAATLIIVLLLAHSFVDYPLRTTALMAVFAFACGLLFEPLGDGSVGSHARRERHDASQTDQDSKDKETRPGRPVLPMPVGSRDDSRLDRLRSEERGDPGGRELPTREPWSWPIESPQSGSGKSAPEPSAPQTASQGTDPADERSGTERWGADIDWPEAWRKPSDPKSGRAKDDPDKA